MKFDNKLDVILESIRNKPAIIYMKNGKVIHADHARIVLNAIGNNVIVAGTGPPVKVQRNSSGPQHTYYKKMRDFYGPHQYIPAEDTRWDKYRQDATGWSEPGEGYGYDAHRNCVWIRKFEIIRFIRPHNVERIEWIA